MGQAFDPGTGRYSISFSTIIWLACDEREHFLIDAIQTSDANKTNKLIAIMVQRLANTQKLYPESRAFIFYFNFFAQLVCLCCCLLIFNFDYSS